MIIQFLEELKCKRYPILPLTEPRHPRPATRHCEVPTGQMSM
jgi:hypothetical protein